MKTEKPEKNEVVESSSEHSSAEYSSVERLSAEHVSAEYPGVEHLSAEHVSAGYSSAIEYLSAETVVIEFTDQASGVKYRRELPLHIEESANGIVLSGENLSGEESSIVFLSQSALERIRELSGEGAEKPRCDNHN